MFLDLPGDYPRARRDSTRWDFEPLCGRSLVSQHHYFNGPWRLMPSILRLPKSEGLTVSVEGRPFLPRTTDPQLESIGILMIGYTLDRSATTAWLLAPDELLKAIPDFYDSFKDRKVIDQVIQRSYDLLMNPENTATILAAEKRALASTINELTLGKLE
ncbi:hypothetical protein M422DRAFT_253268 [Sphaerobolus stellatus SS14]|uniref:Uncharacterized protein n=1 Tax=Sphaerobolus stellatus (strain SS14) TaxID=990650 RepID=A0A0C9VX34_SPHS4|nr:hypothetical protein M422DRAFT_253268 [Sphaerobolus stellatus SS14]